MRKLLTIVVAVAFAGSVASCKKCKDCTIKYTMSGTDYKIEMDEVCGNKKDIEKYESDCAAAVKTWEGLGATNTKCDCVDN